jgi:nucleoside-diphosphate-sugar epimerase
MPSTIPIPEKREPGRIDDLLSTPSSADIEFAEDVSGDILVLGAGGKMGLSLTRRINRALTEANSDSSVVGVSRFSDPNDRDRLESWGVETVAADLLDDGDLAALPNCENIIYMVGRKFGTTGQEPATWAINAYLPGRVARRFRDSRIVAFSTGNVYQPVSPDTDGCTENDELGPIGEYAQSCLGRERVFQHFSEVNETPVCLIRLNYAVEARYGVLLDIANRVYQGEPVPLDVGYVNLIWQGDANSIAFRSLDIADSPAEFLNVAGDEIWAVRDLAKEFAHRFECEAVFDGEPRETALLNDASKCHDHFGEPNVPVEDVIDLIAWWVAGDGPTLGKPTKFHVRDGEF